MPFTSTSFEKRYSFEQKINIWPSMSDVLMTMLLIFIFYIFLQFALNSKYLIRIMIEARMNMIEEKFRETFGGRMDRGEIRVIRDGNMQRFRFSSEMLFSPASDTIEDEGINILRQVGEIFFQNSSLFTKIFIEGHTDNLPIATSRFPSNWELSSARATAVVRFFQGQEGSEIEPSKLSSIGYAEFQPLKVFFLVSALQQSLNNIQETVGEKFQVERLERPINRYNYRARLINGQSAIDEPEQYLRRSLGGAGVVSLDVDSTDARSLNRRIEIVLVYSEKAIISELSAEERD